jgi:hypothetical protein
MRLLRTVVIAASMAGSAVAASGDAVPGGVQGTFHLDAVDGVLVATAPAPGIVAGRVVISRSGRVERHIRYLVTEEGPVIDMHAAGRLRVAGEELELDLSPEGASPEDEWRLPARVAGDTLLVLVREEDSARAHLERYLRR